MTKPTFIKKLKELFIRFNTSPKLYQKSDFYLLLQLIRGLFENSDESLLGEDGKIEEKYLPTIPTENKEYFPDYAFWQKNYVKKGGQCLWVPDSINLSFPTNDQRNANIWLEIDRIHEDSYFQLSAELLQKVCLKAESVDLRFGITDHKTEGDIVYIRYGADLQNVVEWSMSNYGRITIPSENILDWLSAGGEFITFEPEESIGYWDRRVLFINFNNYFVEKPSKTKLYIIRWENGWNLEALSQSQIKCKYHKLTVTLYDQSVKRSTWREYSQPEIDIKTKYFTKEIEYYDKAVGDYVKTTIGAELDVLPDLVFCGINSGYFLPDLDNVKLPLIYSTYQRHSHWKKPSTSRRTARRSFEWTSYTHDGVNRCPTIFEKVLTYFYEDGINYTLASNRLKKLIGSNFGHSIVFVRIPYDYQLKRQSHSWTERSKKGQSFKERRDKVFFKGKIACFRVVFSYQTKEKQISISPDKIEFILPKICY